MKPSTRAITIVIDDAVAKLAAQMEHSATILDDAARDCEALGRHVIAARLRAEAAALRKTAQT